MTGRKSAHIDSIPEAEYSVVGRRLLGDGAQESSGAGLFQLLRTISDYIYSGRRGKVFTMALNTADLAYKPAELQRYYDENSQAIDGYFDKIDMVRLGDMIGGSADQAILKGTAEWFEQQTPPFVVGLIVGAGLPMVMKFISRRT